MSGLRKAELEHLEWDDIDFKAGTITVSPKLDFTPKDHEQRTIEVPDELLTILKELPHRGTTVFANSKGGMYTHSWDDCKAIGDKAKIADSHPHKFRATFATRCLQSGIDLKTVQKLLGHRDIESTMRYLAKAESKKVWALNQKNWDDDRDSHRAVAFRHQRMTCEYSEAGTTTTPRIVSTPRLCTYEEPYAIFIVRKT